jgi:hypothetical protein
MSALPPKADIDGRIFDVRFVPEADIPKAGRPFAEAVIRSVELIVQPDGNKVKASHAVHPALLAAK